MERIEYLPLGSIVLLKGGLQKLMIVSRAINVHNNDRIFFFDYAGVAYPDGLVEEQLPYFNIEKIAKVVFEGYTDIDDENAVDNINIYLNEHTDIIKGSPEDWIDEYEEEDDE